jgi:hypothetical protein
MKLPLASILLAAALPAAAAEPNTLAEADAKTLKEAGLTADNDSLLRYLRGLKPGADVRRQVKGLVAGLASNRFEEREEASRRLTELAGFAKGELEQARRSTDREVARRAKAILDAFAAEADRRGDVLLAVLREIGRRKSPGAVPLLLETPQAWDRADLRRAAEKVLADATRPEDMAALLKALDSPNSYTRIAAAITLLNRGDRRALPALGELLDSTDLEIRNRAGRVLQAVTGQQMHFAAMDAPDLRAKAAVVWRQWLEKYGPTARLTLPAPTDTRLGRVLVCNPTEHRVLELDECGKKVWETNCRGAWCCEGLPNGHRLVGSMFGDPVGEYDTEGNKVWSLEGLRPSAFSVRRLTNGNTLVAVRCHGQGSNVLEFRHDQTICWEASLPDAMPADVQRLEDGKTLVALFATRRVVELDARGEAVWELRDMVQPHSIQRLLNGNTLVSDLIGSRVLEVERSGKVVWAYGVKSPTQAQRLPNGHTVIASHVERIFEVDTTGKILWEYREKGIFKFSAY